jgi:hypothetical protein
METQASHAQSGQIFGQITCKGISDSRGIQRFVQKWIKKWMEDRSPSLTRYATRFDVTFEHESGHMVGCHVKLDSGGQTWTGANYGDNAASALRRALDHMCRVPLLR